MRPKPIRISRASRANSEPRETITGSEKGESKSESGKWASEAFGFLRFYQRVGNQLWGLILIEIGWAVLVLLIAKMLPEQGQKKIHHKSIIDIFLIGAAGLALCWCFSSGVYLYARLLLGRILSGLAALLFYLAFWVLFVLRFLFLFSELRRTRKRLRDEETAAEKKEPIEAAAEKPPASPEIEAEVKKLAKLERDKACDEKALELLDEKAKQLNAPWTLKVARTFETLALPCALGLSRLKLGGRIGLAPIYSFTFEEDRKAAKAPLQAFATGVDRLQNKLQYLVSIQLVRFEVLPPAVKVTTSRRAKMLRSVFGLDAVLWGSYVSIDPPLIAMQIETARAKPKDEKDAWIRKLEIFKGLDPIENEGIIVDQEDTLDAYVAVAMALVHALNAREFRSGGLFSKPFDRLGLYDSSNRNAIITTLVEDGLFALPAVPLKRGAESKTVTEDSRARGLMRSNFSSSPTAKEILTDIAGKWLGWQLDGFRSRHEDVSIEFLEDVALRCTQLEPQDPGNYYRLAAVRLLLGKTDEARKAIEEAGAHDLLARESSRHYLSARAIVDMDLNLSHGERKEAVCAIDVARAVARGGDEERCRLAEEFKKTNIYRRLEIKAEQARDFEDLSLSPIYTMLFESLGLKDSVIEKPEAKEPPPVPPPEAANRDKTGQHTGAD